MNNINNLLNMISKFSQNKDQILQSLNIPVECRGNSQDAIQYLMNTGRISQADYNRANSQLQQLKTNPLFSQFFSK